MLTFPAHPDSGPDGSDASTTILTRVGVSFISTDQACANAEAEIPDFDFDGVHAASFNEWDELLSRVQVDTANVESNITSLLYSSVRSLVLSSH